MLQLGRVVVFPEYFLDRIFVPLKIFDASLASSRAVPIVWIHPRTGTALQLKLLAFSQKTPHCEFIEFWTPATNCAFD